MFKPVTLLFSASLATVAFFSTSAFGQDKPDAKLYEIAKTEPKVTVGTKSAASVTIATKNGWHVNAEAPITLAMTAPPGLTLPKTKLVRADLAASTQVSARFDVPFEASEPGSKVILVDARFVICQETACKPVKETLALNIDVAPAAPPADAPKAKAKSKGKGKPKKS